MSNNDQSMNLTLQGELVIEFVKLFKNAVVKKVDDGNYLDIHMPDIHPKRGTHLWFNTPKSGGIRVGFFCRDKDFKEETLKNHPDSIEAYSNGLRLKGHPIYDDVETALDAAKNFIGYLTTKDAEVEVKKEDELSNDTESPKQEEAMNESDQIFEATEFDEEGKPINTVEDSTDNNDSEDKTNKDPSKQNENKFSQETLERFKRNKEIDLETLKETYKDNEFYKHESIDWYRALAHQKLVSQVSMGWEWIMEEDPEVAKILAKNFHIDKALIKEVYRFAKKLLKKEETRTFGFDIIDIAVANPIFPEVRYELYSDIPDYYMFMIEDEKRRKQWTSILLKNPKVPDDVIETLINDYDSKEAKIYKKQSVIRSIVNDNRSVIDLCADPETGEKVLDLDVEKLFTEEPENNKAFKILLSVLENPECPEDLLKYMVDSSKDEEHDLKLHFNWLLKAIAVNDNTPEDLLNELVNHECYFVQRAAASNQSFAISKAIENLESQSRYVLEGILANPSAKEDTKSKIQELLSDSEKYPEHWMEISANAKTEFLEVHANRFHGKLNSEGSLIYDEVHYEDGFESNYDIDELQGAEESFLKEEGIQDHATETYLYDDSFCRVSVYIPNYEGTAVSTINVYDVLRGWIAAYKIEDLGELLDQCEEYREWMFEVEDIGKVLGMFHHQD